MTQQFRQLQERVLARLPFADKLRASLYLLVGFAISAICLMAFAEIAEEVITQDELVHFDQLLADAIYATVSEGQVRAFAIITLFGGQAIVVIAVIGGLYFALKRHWAQLVVWLVAIGGGELLNLLLKALFDRPRPVFDVPLSEAVNASFPSGHAMMSFITYGLLTYLLFQIVHNLTARILIVGGALLLVVLISLSRLVLGVHFISDIAAGMAAGGVWLSMCLLVLEYIRRREQMAAAAS